MLLITVAGMFAAILVAVVVFLSAGEDRREVRLALRGLADYDLPANVREQEMLKSIQERVLAPFMAKLSGLLGRFTPAGYVQTVREKLVKAGNPAGLDADRFLTLKLLGAVSIVFWPIFAFKIAELSGFYGMIVTGLLWGMSFFGPDVFVQRKIDQRQYLIATRLPDVLDLLVISVEAGLGFEQAIDRTVDAVPGPLADEFRRMLQETRMGATRAEALRAMDERCQVPELRSFILAMLQADTFG
ncbi:MAG: type II secretion system F family protein, partial [Acidimicrobiia bacterium]